MKSMWGPQRCHVWWEGAESPRDDASNRHEHSPMRRWYTWRMVRLTIELDDVTYARLAATAAAKGITVAALMEQSAERGARDDESPAPDFEQAGTEVIEEYRPVLRRLAE
jgi:hypothetical protein